MHGVFFLSPVHTCARCLFLLPSFLRAVFFSRLFYTICGVTLRCHCGHLDGGTPSLRSLDDGGHAACFFPTKQRKPPYIHLGKTHGFVKVITSARPCDTNAAYLPWGGCLQLQRLNILLLYEHVVLTGRAKRDPMSRTLHRFNTSRS